MNDVEPLAALGFARQIVLTAAGLIRGRRPAAVTAKANPADLVTDVDVEVERMVRAAIAARYPGHAVEGEELARTGALDAPTWYLDPIDGAVVSGRSGGEPDENGILVAAPGVATQVAAAWR